MGRNKLLLKVEGRTVLDRLLDAVLASKIDDTVIVLGHRPEAIRPVARGREVRTVLNVEHERGMTSSFQTGLREVDVDAVFLILGDQLGLTPELLDSMIDSMKSDPYTLIVSPEFEGKRGHPSLFRGAIFPEILNLPEEEHMKHVVGRHEEQHRHVPGSIWNTIDFDTPKDFEQALALFRV